MEEGVVKIVCFDFNGVFYILCVGGVVRVFFVFFFNSIWGFYS